MHPFREETLYADFKRNKQYETLTERQDATLKFKGRQGKMWDNNTSAPKKCFSKSKSCELALWSKGFHSLLNMHPKIHILSKRSVPGPALEFEINQTILQIAIEIQLACFSSSFQIENVYTTDLKPKWKAGVMDSS